MHACPKANLRAETPHRYSAHAKLPWVDFSFVNANALVQPLAATATRIARQATVIRLHHRPHQTFHPTPFCCMQSRSSSSRQPCCVAAAAATHHTAGAAAAGASAFTRAGPARHGKQGRCAQAAVVRMQRCMRRLCCHLPRHVQCTHHALLCMPPRHLRVLRACYCRKRAARRRLAPRPAQQLLRHATGHLCQRLVQLQLVTLLQLPPLTLPHTPAAAPAASTPGAVDVVPAHMMCGRRRPCVCC